MSFGFEIYDNNRNSIIPKFGVLDAFIYYPNQLVIRKYPDPKLAELYQNGKVQIMVYEFPNRNPTMAGKPVQISFSTQTLMVGIPSPTDPSFMIAQELNLVVNIYGGNLESRLLVVARSKI